MVCVVLVSLALEASEVEAEAVGEGLSEGEVTAEAGGAVEITVAVLLAVVSVVPEKRAVLGRSCGESGGGSLFSQIQEQLTNDSTNQQLKMGTFY